MLSRILFPVLLLLLLIPGASLATDAAFYDCGPFKDAPSYVSADVNLASIHTESWARNSLNQINPGIGFTYNIPCSWSYSVGFYENSYRRASGYALVNWTPIHLMVGNWLFDAGASAGLVSGYHTREIASQPLVGALLIRIHSPWLHQVGLNLIGVPNGPGRESGFVGFQLTVPLIR